MLALVSWIVTTRDAGWMKAATTFSLSLLLSIPPLEPWTLTYLGQLIIAPWISPPSPQQCLWWWWLLASKIGRSRMISMILRVAHALVNLAGIDLNSDELSSISPHLVDDALDWLRNNDPY